MKHRRKSPSSVMGVKGSESLSSSSAGTDILKRRGTHGRVGKRRINSRKCLDVKKLHRCVKGSRGCPAGGGCGSAQTSDSESEVNDSESKRYVLEPSSVELESDSRHMVAMDCEMVSVVSKSALAKCTILDYDGHVLFDHYVRPEQQIRDYRTKWSGIQPHHMKIALPHKEAVQKIKTILEGCVVIGHDLGHDFSAIGMTHPRRDVRDTAKFPPLREVAGLKKNWSPSLRNLALVLLGRKIQCGSHCSLEDARAALDVYRKYEAAWEKHLLDKKFWFHDQFWPEDIAPSN